MPRRDRRSPSRARGEARGAFRAAGVCCTLPAVNPRPAPLRAVVASLVLVPLLGAASAIGAEAAREAAPTSSSFDGGVALSADVGSAAVSDAPSAAASPSAPTASRAPRLVRFVFEGRTYFKEETLLTFVGSQLDAPVDEEQLAQDARAIADQYRARGYLGAAVDVDVVPVPALATPGASAVVARFDIRAGERAELKAVHVVGNVRVDEAALKDGFFSRPPEPLGALTRAGLFHRPYLEQDQQRVVFNYYKHGFLEARVIDTRVTASTDLGGLAVTLAVAEGPRYELAGLTFTGDLPEGVTSADWRSRVALKDGAVADLVTLNQQTEPLLEAWRERGHPFARFEQQLAVAPPPSGREGDKGILVTLQVVRGPRAVVRGVRIVGNKGTMDHVLRREIVVAPGARAALRLSLAAERPLPCARPRRRFR